MNNKLPSELGDGGLGDLTGVLNDTSVSDLRWLDVNPEDYRSFEALPKQNLDIIPELVEFLTNEKDERIPSLVVQRPITVVNSNPLDQVAPPARSSIIDNIKKKVAAMVMANTTSSEIQKRLSLEYSPDQIRSVASEISEILSERGLLGNVYINASHFPKCHQPKDDSKRFVARFASSSKYVLAKSSCTGCVCNRSGVCSSFSKRIVSSVPYDGATLLSHSKQLINENRSSSDAMNRVASSPEKIRDLLRNSYRMLPVVNNPERVQTAQYQQPIKAPVITEHNVKSFFARRSAGAFKESPTPAPHVLNSMKALMNGADVSLVASSPDSEVRNLASEYGLLGHTYLHVDALGGPAATVSFIKKNHLKPAYVIGSWNNLSEADEIHFNALANIGIYVRAIANQPVQYDGVHLEHALRRAVDETRLTKDEANSCWRKASQAASVDWKAITAQVNLHQPTVKEKTPEYSAPKMSFHHGDTSGAVTTSSVIPEEVRRTVSHWMNMGLHGEGLKKVILSRYTRHDLAQVPEIGQTLASVDGVQGFYHIDPTAYSDYGRGCNAGSKAMRHSKASYVMACSKCTGCSLQSAPGWCSKYAKKLARTIPDSEVQLAAKRVSLPIIQSHLPVENPVEKYELASEMEVDLNGFKHDGFDISISGDGNLDD